MVIGHGQIVIGFDSNKNSYLTSTT